MLPTKQITPSASIKFNELNQEDNLTHKIVNITNSLDKISTKEDIRIDELLINKQYALGLNYYFCCSSNTFDESALLQNRLQHSLIRNGRRWSTGNINETKIHYTEKVTMQDDGIVWFKGSQFIESTHFNVNNESVSAHTFIPKKANFLVEYTKSKWKIMSSFKEGKTSDFFMSEIIRMQFKIASKKGGFEGRLPSIICINNITNELSCSFMNKYQHLKSSFKGDKTTKDLISEFLSLDGNGKSTCHILNTFRMQAIDIDIDSDSIYIHVVPMK